MDDNCRESHFAFHTDGAIKTLQCMGSPLPPGSLEYQCLEIEKAMQVQILAESSRIVQTMEYDHGKHCEIRLIGGDESQLRPFDSFE